MEIGTQISEALLHFGRVTLITQSNGIDRKVLQQTNKIPNNNNLFRQKQKTNKLFIPKIRNYAIVKLILQTKPIRKQATAKPNCLNHLLCLGNGAEVA